MSQPDDSSFTSLESAASSVDNEVQQLDYDVISQVERGDDLMGTGALNRALSNRTIASHSTPHYNDTNSVSSAAEDTEVYGLNKERTPGSFSGSFGRRRSSIMESIKRFPTIQQLTKFSWWDNEFKRQRIKVYYTFFQNYLILSVILVCVLSIYWGSYYGRPSRYVNLKILVVNDDQEVVDGVTAIVGNALNLTASLPTVSVLGGWRIFNGSVFESIANEHNNSIVQEIKRQVHHQKYWGAIHVRPNATAQLYEAIVNQDQNFTVTNNLIDVYYETGRDYITMSTYVIKFLRGFERGYQQVIKSQFPILISQLETDEDKINALTYLSQPFTFQYIDMVPVPDPILLAPLQLGLTYLIIFAFFQMVMTIRIQIYLSTLVKGLRYVALRILISQFSYAIISLGYVLLNIAFQIDHTATFGRSGGLVLWALSYLTMSSLGGLNECVAILCFLYYPPLIGGWLVMLMVLNVAPTTSSMALTNNFYRYGYAMPVHNSYEAVKVVFSNIYKGNMGRNIGILVTWIVLSNMLLPFVMVHASKVMAKRADQEAAEKQVTEPSRA